MGKNKRLKKLRQIKNSQKVISLPIKSANVQDEKSKNRYSTLIKLLSILSVVVGALLIFSRIETKNFSLDIFNSDEISFITSKEDSVKSPLCSCPNPSLNNYGFLQFFKEVSISNSNDTTSFTITSPSPSNLTTYPSHQFEADIYLLRKKEFGEFDIDSIFKNQNYLNESEIIKKAHLDNLYFLSLINDGHLKVKYLSDNTISAFLPGSSAKVSFKNNRQKYSDIPESVRMGYEASYKSRKDHKDAFFDFFGPKLIFYSKSIYELLGEKGPLLNLGSINKQDSIYRNSFLVFVIDVPYTARVSLGEWNKEREEQWQDELSINTNKNEQFESVALYNHIPWMLIDKSGKPTFYDFLRDSNAKYLPPIFPQSHYNFFAEYSNPLSKDDFESLRNRCSLEGKIFVNPKYKNGVTFYEIERLNLNLPKKLDSSFQKYIEKEEISFPIARKKGKEILEIYDKYGATNIGKQKNATIPIVYYYPEIPEINGIYYYGNLDSLTCKRSNIEYSYGITGSKQVNNCELSLTNVVINNQKPYYTLIPVLQTKDDKISMNINVNAKMYINGERVGDSFFNNPLFQNIGLIFGLIGIGLIGLLSNFLSLFKFKK